VQVAAEAVADAPAHLRDWDAEHPALSRSLAKVCCRCSKWSFTADSISRATTLEPVANWPDGKMAVAEINSIGRRLFIAGFPLDREATDWPAQPSFVPFAALCKARWLGAFRGTHNDWRVGDTVHCRRIR